ncbi:MAG: GNAT family N-acetyltransferase [Acidimicrobiales bacterium]
MHRLRPLRDDDIPACQQMWVETFTELARSHRREEHPPSATDLERMRLRMAHSLRTDPGGAWVAVDDGDTVVGLAVALVREGLSILSMLAVATPWQRHGIGRDLIGAALQYGGDDAPGIILSSYDPRAKRRYVRAGFDLQPEIGARGTLSLARVPEPRHEVRVGNVADLEYADDLARRMRGAAHGPDTRFYLDIGATLLVADGGFALFGDTRPVLVAAEHPEIAEALFYAGFARIPDGTEVDVSWLTGEQQWGIRACVELGLELRGGGAVMLRHLSGLAPYLPSGAFG